MPSSIHYTCYKLNIKDNFFGLNKDKYLFHDRMENNRNIIVVYTDISDIIKKNVCYIFIYEKNKN